MTSSAPSRRLRHARVGARGSEVTAGASEWKVITGARVIRSQKLPGDCSARRGMSGRELPSLGVQWGRVARYNHHVATLTDSRKKSLRREMEALLGPGAVLSDPDELLVYESDGLTLFRALADFVVFPTSAEQVAGLVISLMRMNRVLEVDYDNQVAIVEPGLVNLHLSWAVGPRGFYYAPDPSSQQACTIGGNIATNSGGPHTLKYGVTVNHVLGLEVVMPEDGSIVWLGGRTRE